MSLVFPPFVIFAPLFMIIAGVSLPLVLYKHFFRILGPGSAIFEAIPYYIRWYLWYPIILLIGKPVKFFKMIFKGGIKFITKTIPKGIIYFFTKFIPMMVKMTIKVIVSFITDIFKSLSGFFGDIGSAFGSFFKVIMKFGQAIGNVFKAIWNGIVEVIQDIGSVIGAVFGGIKKAFDDLKGLFR